MVRAMGDILSSARDDLRERWADYRSEFGSQGDDTGDVIHEIADGHVPVYTSDLMALAAEDINLATAEPELGPAFDGSPTPVNIVAANVYEAITASLWDDWREIEEEEEEKEEAEALEETD